MHNVEIQRWCFTDYELDNPEVFKTCRAFDEFLADAGPETDLAVIVYRNGGVSNRWEDGTAGVQDECRDIADSDESPIKDPRLRQDRDFDVFADNWRNVVVAENGSPTLTPLIPSDTE